MLRLIPSLMLLLLVAPSALVVNAIVTAGDPNDEKFLGDLLDAKFFVSLGSRGDCAGTVVGNSNILTAAHCVADTNDQPKAILYDGTIVRPWAAFMNPKRPFLVDEDGPNGNDVAVLAFAKEIATQDMILPIYPGDAELGKIITIYGYGITGSAADLTGRKCRGKEDGKFRKATNVVTDTSDGVIRYRMDNAANGGLDTEGMAQDGDSGGTVTMTVDDVTYVVGANSGTEEKNSCDYGSIDEYNRVSEHFDFISKIMNPDDESICPWKVYEEPESEYNPDCTPASGGSAWSRNHLFTASMLPFVILPNLLVF